LIIFWNTAIKNVDQLIISDALDKVTWINDKKQLSVMLDSGAVPRRAARSEISAPLCPP